jgi:hypothetical protein
LRRRAAASRLRAIIAASSSADEPNGQAMAKPALVAAFASPRMAALILTEAKEKQRKTPKETRIPPA